MATQGFPNDAAPVVDGRGIIQKAWKLLLLALWKRTGGNAGYAKIAQVVMVETSALGIGTGTFPGGNTLPPNTSGDPYLEASITPTDANSTLVVEVVWLGSNSVATNIWVGLFDDASANALAVVAQYQPTATGMVTIPLRHKMTAGKTSVINFSVRAGGGAAGTTTCNGTGGAQVGGGAAASSIKITELAP